METYRLLKAERKESGMVTHHVLLPGNREEEFRYRSVRIGLVWPTVESPAYFVVGGEEVWNDDLEPKKRGLLRVFQEYQCGDLSLNVLFEALTDSYCSTYADELYVDRSQKDVCSHFYEFIDVHNLRNISVADVPFKDIVLRLGVIKDYNDSGDLLIEKSSPLCEDLKGLSRSHLADKPETKFFRLNALSYLVSGFSKYPPAPKLRGPGDLRTAKGWMI